MGTGGLILIIMAALALIVFLVRENRKDRKSLVDKLNRDYRKPPNDEGDVEIDEVKK